MIMILQENRKNENCSPVNKSLSIRNVLKDSWKFLDFSGNNAAEIVNNYSWFKDMGFLEFLRMWAST